MHEASLYRPLENNDVECELCAHGCVIKPGKTGICKVRLNREGTLDSLVYGRPIARNVDPIEKKPLYHFLPGTLSYSIACVGCNLACRHCQNADIAHMPRDTGRIQGGRADHNQVAAGAAAADCASISYTYTEPTVFGEYVRDICIHARRAGMKNVFVSNGYLSPKSTAWLGPLLDGANIDLKSFSDSFYREVCGARLEPVLETLKGLKELGVWLEVTTLLIPGLNDSAEELSRLTAWLVDNLGEDTPWHISRFHPAYKLTDRDPTPLTSLETAFATGRAAGLRYVYLGNVPGRGGENTVCPGCGATLIDRLGFQVRSNAVDQGRCPHCGRTIAGVWE